MTRFYDGSKAAEAAKTTRYGSDINDIISSEPPEGSETWNTVIMSDFGDTGGQMRATQWLHHKKAKFNESYTGVYWIEDDLIAVEFKLLFS